MYDDETLVRPLRLRSAESIAELDDAPVFGAFSLRLEGLAVFFTFLAGFDPIVFGLDADFGCATFAFFWAGCPSARSSVLLRFYAPTMSIRSANTSGWGV